MRDESEMIPRPITDEEIVAFLDDALGPEDQARIAHAAAESPDVAARIEALYMDRDGLVAEFDGLLASAPEMTIPEPTLSVATPANSPRPVFKVWQAAAAVAILALGIGIGTQIPTTDHADAWHVAVADYQALYGTETLTGMVLSSEQRWGSLATASSAVGLEISRQEVQFPGLDFRRAQVLSMNGAPLAQLAFLDGDGNAIAFCFTRTNGPDRAPEHSTLSGLASVTWQRNGIGYILIGGKDATALEKWQSQLDQTVGT